MAARVISPARQAWNKGIRHFFTYAWDKEPVLLLSVIVGSSLPLVYLFTPTSVWDRYTEINSQMPREYPTPIRYEEGKTGPPTSV